MVGTMGEVNSDLELPGTRRTVALLTAALFLAAGLVTGSAVSPASAPLAPVAQAAPCPDVEVIFARGRVESPGPGIIGNAFVNSLRSKTDKNVALYAVQYPADYEIDIGANDMSRRIQHMAATCDDTRLVLGGYSLGAAVPAVVLAVPISALGFDSPLPAGVDRHIAAIALFGNGIAWAGPISNFSPLYAERTIELCHGADPICNPADPETWRDNWSDHAATKYVQSGMVDQAADFVAARL